jgi:hypothetical protein
VPQGEIGIEGQERQFHLQEMRRRFKKEKTSMQTQENKVKKFLF